MAKDSSTTFIILIGALAVGLFVINKLSEEDKLSEADLYRTVPHYPTVPNCADFIPGVQYVGQVEGGWIVVTGGTVIGQYPDKVKAQNAYNLIVCGILA